MTKTLLGYNNSGTAINVSLECWAISSPDYRVPILQALDLGTLRGYYPHTPLVYISKARSEEPLSAKAARAISTRLERRKSASRSQRTEEVDIPDKLYFRIGEVARLCRLPAYVLRFWETEFPQLKPVKSKTGQRMYRRREVEIAVEIRRLLYKDGLTIPGARQHLLTERKSKRAQTALPFHTQAPQDNLRRVRQGLKEVLAILEAKKK